MHQLVAVHGRRWVLVASSIDNYLTEDKHFVDIILKFVCVCCMLSFLPMCVFFPLALMCV